jgi:hypothetical protein
MKVWACNPKLGLDTLQQGASVCETYIGKPFGTRVVPHVNGGLAEDLCFDGASLGRVWCIVQLAKHRAVPLSGLASTGMHQIMVLPLCFSPYNAT